MLLLTSVLVRGTCSRFVGYFICYELSVNVKMCVCVCVCVCVCMVNVFMQVVRA